MKENLHKNHIDAMKISYYNYFNTYESKRLTHGAKPASGKKRSFLTGFLKF